MDLSGKQVAMIIAHEKFRDEEYAEPREILEAAGAEVTVFSSSMGTARGMLGMAVEPDRLIAELKVEEFDAVAFVGGGGSSEYWDDATAHAIAKETVNSGKILGAICIAPVTLARAGVLQGKRATVWSSERSKLEAGGCTFTGNAVEVDGNIITANGPQSARKFGEALATALKPSQAAE